MRHCAWLLLLAVAFSLTSCFTGIEHHHSRVKVEQNTRPVTFLEKADYPKDSSQIIHSPQRIESAPSSKENQPVRVEQTISQQKTTAEQKRYFKTPSKSTTQKKVFKTKETRESLLGVLGLFIALIAGLIGLILVVTGFILGMFGIIIGFGITWALGLAILLFALVIAIIVSTVGYDDLFSGISIIAYILFIILAIVFLLVVLL